MDFTSDMMSPQWFQDASSQMNAPQGNPGGAGYADATALGSNYHFSPVSHNVPNPNPVAGAQQGAFGGMHPLMLPLMLGAMGGMAGGRRKGGGGGADLSSMMMPLFMLLGMHKSSGF